MKKADNTRRTLSSSTRHEVKTLLRGGYSHARFGTVIENFPVELRGIVPEGLPYSAWQVLEHMRIAQRNMLDYATQTLMKDSGRSEQGLRQPRDYWVKRASTPNEECWENSVSQILEDRKAFELLIDEATDEALITPSAPRNRKTVLRLALQIADHTAYHTGQLVIIRRLLCSWEK